MEQPVCTVLFVLAQKSIIVILKALNISTFFFFCQFILTFRQLYLFRLTQRFFNSTWSPTLQWWQLCCISRLVSVLSGEGRDQHMTTNFNCSFVFFSFFLSVWYSWYLFYSWLPTLSLSISPKCINRFFFFFLPIYLSPSSQWAVSIFAVSTETSSCRQFLSQTLP